MRVALRTNLSAFAAIGILLCIAASVPYWPYTDGDASIYFTFLKGFFDKPFSYAPGVVSFGATSPLHVLVFAPIHHLFGAEWIYVAKVLNLLLVLTGAWMIGRSTRHPLGMSGAFAAVAATPQLMENTFDLFEVGVVFLVGAGCVAALVEERWKSALLWAGFAYLARPELILAAAGAVVYVGSRAGRRAPWAFLMPGLIATTGYHWWMASQGAGWLPTSVTGRLHRVAGEAGGSWAERFAGSYAPKVAPSERAGGRGSGAAGLGGHRPGGPARSAQQGVVACARLCERGAGRLRGVSAKHLCRAVSAGRRALLGPVGRQAVRGGFQPADSRLGPGAGVPPGVGDGSVRVGIATSVAGARRALVARLGAVPRL